MPLRASLVAHVSYLCHHPTTALFSLPTPFRPLTPIIPRSYSTLPFPHSFHAFSIFLFSSILEKRRLGAQNALTSRTYVLLTFRLSFAFVQIDIILYIYSEGWGTRAKFWRARLFSSFYVVWYRVLNSFVFFKFSTM